MSTTRLLDHFSAPDDPRQSWKVTYPLPEVQLLTEGGCDEISGALQAARDGLFTPALLRYIEQPGIEITAMLRRVRRDVQEASDGKQMPANYDQLVTEVYPAGGAR